MIQKVSRHILFFVGVIIFVGPSVVLADISSPHDMDEILWEGKIEIYQSGSIHYAEDKSTKDSEHQLSGSKNFLARITIKACGYSGNLTVKDAVWSFSNEENENETKTRKKTRCSDGSITISPGSSDIIDKKIRETIYKGIDCMSPIEETIVSLNVFRGKYILQAGSSMYRQIITNEGKKSKINVCSGEQTLVSTNRVITTSFSNQEQMIPGTDSFTIKQHPKRYSLSIKGKKGAVQKVGDTIVIQGEVEPKTEESGDHGYKETFAASWHFEGKLKCKEVLQQLNMDLSYAEAFANKDLQDRAKRIPAKRVIYYKKLVQDYAEKIYKSSSGGDPGNGAKSKVSMSTTNKCRIKPDVKRKFKNAIARNCLPKVLYKAALEHEKKHVYQCLKYETEFLHGGEDPSTHGLMEVPAYLAGAEVLLNWLKENCDENYDLSDLEARMNTLKSLPILIYN